MRLRVGAATDIGRVRELNEDAYMLRVAQGLFVVCDGMGGAPAGEVASQIAADTILATLDRADNEPDPARADEQRYRSQTRRLADAVRESNRVIYNQGRQDPSQAEMGTTVVSAWLQEDIASVVHVGDSRAYLWHGGRLEALTRDHSLLEALAREGFSDHPSAMDVDQQGILLRVLGGEPDVDVDLAEVCVKAGDYLLLCSDGLTRMVPEATVEETIARVRDPQRICDCLIEIANRNGGADNITAIVVEVGEGWWRRLSNRWKRFATGGYDADAHSQV